MSLTATAELAGMTGGYLSMIERGLRAITKRSVLEALAHALRVSPSELTGQPYTAADPVSAEGRAALNEVRVALDAYELGLDPEITPRPWPLLAADAHRLNTDLRADYAGQGAILPDLLAELHAAYVRDPEHRRDALIALMYAYYAATCTTKNLGGVDGWPLLAALHARSVAEELDAPEWLAYAAYLRAYATGQQNRPHQHASVIRALDQIGPHTNTDIVQVAGMLHLSAALASTAQGKAEEARLHLAEATHLTTHLPDNPDQNPNFAYLYFSRDNVGIWSVGLNTDLGEGGRVAEIARDVHPETIPAPDRQGIYWSDLGRALACEPATRDQSVQSLIRAERIAPQLIRTRPLVRETVLGLLPKVAHSSNTSRELRGLAYRMGIAPTR
ncbi:transcriptional regulator with XRE-family HTH domain [Saccharopolyspora phatthalungensis]|uniref:Transcriptional regulator with XRE-family HTH domain n=2 Tax=Saccharopolyspora phatthalungensis TaxID=664693 RepID=A0A840QKJ1_9PSEU|nr:transcriptional regulator with XRE-family HTH domain [Saccharopolyspora phatthalungensis]